MNLKDSLLVLSGIYMIIVSFIAYYQAIFSYHFSLIFWFSYSAFLLIGIGIVRKNGYLIGSQINIVLFPYIFWNIDFFYQLIFKEQLFGITNYVFEMESLLSLFVTLHHIILIPLAFISLYFIKVKRTDFWKLSLIQGLIFLTLTKLFSDPELNINCVFENCLPFQINNPLYFVLWILCFVLMVFVVNFFLMKIKIFRN